MRCDRTQPACQKCERLGVQCPGYHDEGQAISRPELLRLADSIYSSSGVKKRRFGSCESCKVAKERCTKTKPACRRCSLRGLQCVYQAQPHGNRRQKVQNEATTNLTSASTPVAEESPQFRMSEDDPNRSMSGLDEEPRSMRIDTQHSLFDDKVALDQLVNTFFDRVHPLRCSSYLHKPSFLFSIDRGTVVDDYGEPLLYAMCARAARFVCYPFQPAMTFH